jgi:hypothetical protein
MAAMARCRDDVVENESKEESKRSFAVLFSNRTGDNSKHGNL